jgi:uncharacterized membrane protein YdjX (TVP38/TMEM64 family)
VPLGVLLLGLALFFGLGFNRYLTFHSLAEHRAWLLDQVARERAFAIVTYVVVYACLVALSVPGGVLFTMTGGFLFGPVIGTAAAVIAATAGATSIFLAIRAGLGDGFRRRAGPFVARLETGFQRNPFGYLLTLRLVPFFPFWLINLVPAFLGMRLRSFVLATLLGTIPGTLIFSSIGNGLGAIFAEDRVPDLETFRQPEIALPLVGLALLSLLPIAYRRWRGTSDRERR